MALVSPALLPLLRFLDKITPMVKLLFYAILLESSTIIALTPIDIF